MRIDGFFATIEDAPLIRVVTIAGTISILSIAIDFTGRTF